MEQETLNLARPTANAVREVFGVLGAKAIEPPALQPLGPYIDLSGEDVRRRLFVVESPDGARLCLRPDMTIPVCLHHIQATAGTATPALYQVDGQVFRFALDPQFGPAEFGQIGLERFGDTDPVAADVEMCALALEAVRAGGGKISRFMLGDAFLFPAFVHAMGLDGEQADRLIRRTRQGDKNLSVLPPPAMAGALASVGTDQAAEILSEMFDLAGVEPVGRRPIAAIAQRLQHQAKAHEDAGTMTEAGRHARALMAIEGAPREALDAVAALCGTVGVNLDDRLQAWAKRLDALDGYGLPDSAVLSVTFARQFQYYDGMVFEAWDEALGLAKVMAAGGRYDGLFERLGGREPLTGIGIMARPLRIARSALMAKRGGGQ